MSQTPSAQIETGHRPTGEELAEQFGDEWRATWLKLAEGMFKRNGTNPNYSGQRIAQNPLLQEAIREIRDEYFNLLVKKLPLVKLMQETDSDYIDQRGDLLQRLHDSDADLVLLNAASLARLKQPNYGFDDEKAQSILGDTNRTAIREDLNGLYPRTAAAVVGSIVGRAIDAFEFVFCEKGYPRMNVPNDFSEENMLTTAQTQGRVMPAPPDFGRDRK